MMGDSAHALSDGLLKGKNFVFSRLGANDLIRLQNVGAVPVEGNAMVYSFSDAESLNVVKTAVSLRKRYYRVEAKSGEWVELEPERVIHLGDKIRITLELESAKPLRYVHIEDARAAAFEPEDLKSGYEYSSGFALYKSVRDGGYQFFADMIGPGRWQIDYVVRAEQEGTFSSGPARLECMYKPEVVAYSTAARVTVE
jgi:uncharacterized protein YfaS (alpha-2-macroglobulin family)